MVRTVWKKLLLAGLAYVGLAGAQPGAASPVVYVANYPLEYFASRIAGGHARIVLPVPAGADPAFWAPDEASLLDLQRADLILLNGAGHERWAGTVSLPLNRVVDTTAALAERFIYTDDAVTHTHGPAGAHAHENLAFTTWLDLDLAARQARRVGDALARLLPQREQELRRNLDGLTADLEALDAELRSTGERFGGQPLLASHPVYAYFGRRYGFDLSSVHWEPGEHPPAGEWQRLDVLLETHPAKWMIWEAEPLPETRDALAQRGVTALVFRPLANRPERGDFVTVMQANAAALARVPGDAARP